MCKRNRRPNKVRKPNAICGVHAEHGASCTSAFQYQVITAPTFIPDIKGMTSNNAGVHPRILPLIFVAPALVPNQALLRPNGRQGGS